MKNKKIWLLLSLGCILSGIFFLFAGTLLGGIPGFYVDRTGVHTSREAADQRRNVFQDTVELDAFDRIELDVSYVEDVSLVPSDRYAVEYRTWGSAEEPVCRVEDGRLLFREGPFSGSDSRIWFLYADPGSEYTRELEPGPYYVTIEYPADQTFTDVVIRMESGDLKLPRLQADTLDIRDEYGDVSLEGYTGTTWNLHMSSGNLTVGTVTAEQAQLESEYGDVDLDGYTGSSLEIHMSSGNLSLGSMEAERMEIHNEYGEVLIDQAAGDSLTADLSSGSFLTNGLDIKTLKVQNEYGTVRIRLPEDLSGYGYQLKTEYGSILLDGKRLTNHDEDESENECHYTSAGTNGKTVEIFCDSGEILIDPAP